MLEDSIKRSWRDPSMRKAPRTGPGPLCRAAAGVGKFGGIRRKASPCGPGSQRCLSWGQIRPQLALAISVTLWALHCLTQGQCCSVEQDSRIWGRCRKVQEGTQRAFPRARAALEQEEASSKSWKVENRGGGNDSRTSQELSLPTVGAVPKPEYSRVPKACRFQLGSRCEEPQEQFWGAGWQHKQPAAKISSVENSTRALWGAEAPSALESKGEDRPRV